MESAFGRQSSHSARQSRSAKFYGDNGSTFRHTSVTTRDHRPGDTGPGAWEEPAYEAT